MTGPALRIRFWVESTFAVLAGLTALATLVADAWIEAVFHLEPDGGGGELERVVPVVFAVATVVLSLLARGEWRRRSRPAVTPAR